MTADKVAQVFAEHSPNGGTVLAPVLKHAFDDYFKRKAAGQTKANGDLIMVVTDGEPEDRDAVATVIIEATKNMERDEELAVGFVQIGRDTGAAAFLKSLDDDLQGKGAKFDIVDAVTSEEAEGMTFVELLTKVISD